MSDSRLHAWRVCSARPHSPSEQYEGTFSSIQTANTKAAHAASMPYNSYSIVYEEDCRGNVTRAIAYYVCEGKPDPIYKGQFGQEIAIRSVTSDGFCEFCDKEPDNDR